MTTRIKKTSVAGRVPNTFVLSTDGDIGVNTHDGRLWISNGSVVSEIGANATGTATLIAGTVTVSTAAVTSTTRIFLTTQSLGTVTVPKSIAVTSRVNGTSFTITSEDNTDTSVIAWMFVQP